MRIVALGASGNAGREVVRLLGPGLGAGDEVVLAGRNAARLAETMAVVDGLARVSRATLDVENTGDVRRVVDGADVVVVTVSRPDLVGDLARAALDAGADWLDTLLSTGAKHAALSALAPEIEGAGRCFVTDAGFHPGLPAVLVRWAAAQLDEIHEADVMGGMRIDWRADTLADSTVTEMLDEFSDFSLDTYIDGRRRPLRWSECPKVDFGPPIGVKTCVPMPLAEMDSLPTLYPALRRCGFYICGFGPVMDYVALPVLMVLAKVRPLRGATVGLTRWSMGRLASYPPPHRLQITLAASGLVAGRAATASVSVGGADGYLLTAAPAVACLRRVMDGSIRRPGLHLQAHLVAPDPFLDDLAALGLDVEHLPPVRTDRR